MTLTLQEEEFKERRCRLICLDLDGTLLNDEKEIDPEESDENETEEQGSGNRKPEPGRRKDGEEKM